MRRFLILSATAAILTPFSSAAWAQGPSMPPPTSLPPSATAGTGEIIVEGRKLTPDDVNRIVRSISHPEPTGGFESQYPRWNDHICVLVGGFPQAGGRFIADRIGEVARSLNLEPGKPGCTPNVFILASNDPDKLIAGLRLKRHGLVSGKDVSIVRRIQHSHDPVRWIGATDISGGQGSPVQGSDFGLAGSSTPETQAYNGGSRIEASTQTFLSRETIIVDGKQTGGVSYGQLADYLALVTLAQLNPHAAAPGASSILSLFPRGDTAPKGLTAFDKAYLVALYQSNAGAVGTIQRRQMETSINQTLRKVAAPTDQPDISRPER